MTPMYAETIALKALAFLAASPENVGRFINNSGIEAGNLRQCLDEPGFLGAILDFLLRDETFLLSFCESENLSTRTIHSAAQMLDGTSTGDASQGCA